MVTAGCASGGGAGGTSGQEPAGAKNDATLRVAWPVSAMAMDPHTASSDVAQFSYASLVYDRLTMTKADGSLGPMLATDWQPAGDGLSYTFTLRDRVTFTDGEKVDAAAVKASFDRALFKSESTAKNRLSMIAGVEVVGPMEVRISTKRPARDLPYVVSGIVGAIISPKALNDPDLDQNPVGSGAYSLSELKIGQSATYTRRDGYWDADAAKPKTIVLSGMSDDNSRLNSLRSGQVDLIMGKLGSWRRAEELPKDKFATTTYPTTQSYDLFLNTSRPMLQDVKVRQALNYAIDRDAINSAITEGQCKPQAQPFNDAYLNATSFPGQLPPTVRTNIEKSLDPRLTDAEADAAAKAAADEVVSDALTVTVCAYGSWWAHSTAVQGADQQGVAHYQGGPDLRYVGINAK